MTIGELIKAYRKEHKMSQREFAAKCGLSNGMISLFERGTNPKTNEPITPTLPTLNCIATGMGLKIDKLLEKADDIDVSLSRSSETTILGITPALTQNEEQLLIIYRDLNEEGQEHLLAMAETVANTDRYKKEGNKSGVAKAEKHA